MAQLKDGFQPDTNHLIVLLAMLFWKTIKNQATLGSGFLACRTSQHEVESTTWNCRRLCLIFHFYYRKNFGPLQLLLLSTYAKFLFKKLVANPKIYHLL